MKKLLIPVAVISLAVLLLSVFVLYKLGPLSKAPDISLNIIDGQEINLRSLQGKPVLVTFWSTSCVTCIKEMPHLKTLYNELNQHGLEIIGIAMPYDPPNLVLEVSTKKNIPYPIALDIDGSVTEAFGNVLVTPTSFLIDQEGNIVMHDVGELKLSELKLKIQELLQNKSNSIS